jgi:hypothetical protein
LATQVIAAAIGVNTIALGGARDVSKMCAAQQINNAISYPGAPYASLRKKQAGFTSIERHGQRAANGHRRFASYSRASESVAIDQATAWKLLTKHRSLDAIRRQFPAITITGDKGLGLHVLGMVSVMA